MSHYPRQSGFMPDFVACGGASITLGGWKHIEGDVAGVCFAHHVGRLVHPRPEVRHTMVGPLVNKYELAEEGEGVPEA